MDIEFYNQTMRLQPLATGEKPDFKLMRSQLLLRRQRTLLLQAVLSGLVTAVLLIVK